MTVFTLVKVSPYFFSAGRERQPSENAQKMPEAKLGNHSKIQKQQFDDDLIKVIMMILIFVYPETTYLLVITVFERTEL